MRRSSAPSQKYRKDDSPIQTSVESRVLKGFILPITITPKRARGRSSDNRETKRKPLTQCNSQILFVSDHEELIKKLSRPFKCPIANYEGCNSTKNLGIRKTKVKRALYDPNMPNALVLYAPPEMTEHEKLKNEGPLLVHVVVDPLLGNILRPHQREV